MTTATAPVTSLAVPATRPFAASWQLLVDAVRKAAGADPSREPPILLSSLPDLPATNTVAGETDRFSFVQGPPGRIVSLAIGLRAAMPNTPLVLIMGADSVMLGTNHLIHAVRRNIAMTVILLRADVTADAPLGEIDRLGWQMPSWQQSLETPARPLEWATALGAAFVARASLREPVTMVSLLREAMNANGFALVGVTDGANLPLGELSRTPSPEFFDQYRTRIGEPALAAARAVLAHPEEVDAPRANERVEADTRATRVATPERPARGTTLPRCEVRICGLGGHGVKLAGTVLSEAAGLVEGRWATQRGEYGSATRGGPSMVDVVLGSDPITYPSADHPNVLVALTPASAKRFASALPAGGRLVVDADEVISPPDGALVVPITALARKHTGKPIAAGMVAVGVVAALTGAVSLDSLRSRIAANLPAKATPDNIAACEAGHRAALEALESSHG